MDPLLLSLLDILKYILPSVVVAVIAYVIMGKLMEDSQSRLELEIRKTTAGTFTPTKLQAYERMILLLERISPPSLIQEYNSSDLTAQELRHTMIIAINAEYSHNLSQQIYISNQAWSLVKIVKEEVIDFINSTFETLPRKSSGIDFSKKMIDKMIEMNTQPTQKAIDFIKAEIRLYF